MRARQAIAAIAAVTLALGAAGCATTPEEVEPVSLRMTLWSSAEPHLALFNAAADAYMADHPEIESITFDSLPYEDYLPTLTTQIAGGVAPDLAWIPSASAPDFIRDGALAPLTETFKATEGYDYDDIIPALTPAWSEDEELLAYPFSNSPFTVYVNEDLAAAAGIASVDDMISSGDWTWENLIEAGAQVKASTGKEGLLVKTFDFQQWQNLNTIWIGWGAEVFSADGTECTLDSNAMVDAFETIHSAVFEKSAMPGPGVSVDFAAGDVAFQLAQISQAAPLADVDFEWSINPLPSGPAGTFANVGQAGMGALASGKNVKQATEFLAFLTNPENAANLAQFFPPPRTSLLNAATLGAANPLIPEDQLQAAVVDQVPLAAAPLDHTGWAEIQQKVRAALDAMWVPNADVSQVLSDTCGAISPLLDK